MSKYATNTSVSVDTSRNEIEKVLKRYGAKSFMYATQESKALIMFEANGKRIRFILTLPDISERRFMFTAGRGIRRTAVAQAAEHEQACRSSWRALVLVIKAKLEAVESKISTFEDEFMANIILPNGQTASEYLMPKINESYVTNTLPPMLNFGGVK